MKRNLLVVGALVACVGVGTTFLAQTLTPSGVLTLSETGTTTTSSWLPGWLYKREAIDYAAITAEAIKQRSRLLTQTVVQNITRDQTLTLKALGIPSRARVRVTYRAEYPIGYVLEPGHVSVSSEDNTLVLTLGRPTLLSAVAIKLKGHQVLEGGLLIDEQEALLQLQQTVQAEAQQQAPAILARPGIIPASEQALRAFLEPILAARAAGTRAPLIRFQYR